MLDKLENKTSIRNTYYFYNKFFFRNFGLIPVVNGRVQKIEGGIIDSFRDAYCIHQLHS